MTTYVRGIGAWMLGRGNVASVLGDAPSDAALQRPACIGVSSRLLRGTSMLTRMSVDVAFEALAGSGLDAAAVCSVFASSYGEIQIAIDQLEMMVADDGQISPVAFKNSVHNTAAGVFAIAAGNHEPATAIAAGPCSLPYALLEAELLLDDGASGVIVVAADEAKPAPLDAIATPPFAVGLALSRNRGNTRPLAQLTGLAQVRAGSQTASELPANLRDHPARAGYALLLAICGGDTRCLGLGEEDGDSWTVEVSPAR